MTEEQRAPVSMERILLIILAVLLVLALSYIALDIFSGDGILPTAQDSPETALVDSEEETPVIVSSPTEAPAEQEAIQEIEQATPTPRRLQLPPTPTPFSVSDEDDPRAVLNLSSPDLFDYFNIPENWLRYESEGFASYDVTEGQLVGTDHDPERKGIYWSHNSRPSGNTYAEITATNGDCASKDAVGLVIRIDAEQTPSGYALEVSCDGAWRFLRYRPTSTDELIDWTPSEVIRTGNGSANRLGLWGYAGKFNLFVNGVQVGDYFDNSYAYSFGYFAAYVRSAQTFDLTAHFDDFAAWDVPFIP